MGASAYALVGDPAKGAFVSVSDGAPLQFTMKDGRAVGAPGAMASLERVGPLDSPGPLAMLCGLTALAAGLTLLGSCARHCYRLETGL